jgi:hypothetical protein
MLLGCVNFSFNDKTRTCDIPGSKPHKNHRGRQDGWVIEAGPPGDTWTDAMRRWTQSAKPLGTQ